MISSNNSQMPTTPIASTTDGVPVPTSASAAPNTAEGESSSVSSSAAADKALLLFDWNRIPPDGSSNSISKLLTCIESEIRGHVSLGYEVDGKMSEVLQRDSGDEHPQARLLQSAILESSRSTGTYLYAAANGNNSAVLDSFRTLNGDALVLGVCIQYARTTTDDASDQVKVGIVVNVADSDQLQRTEAYTLSLAKLAAELPTWLETWRLGKEGRILDRRRHKWNSLAGRKGMLYTLIGAICIGTCFISVPYRPGRECVVEPASRTFVASPIDGHVSNAVIRPGDPVEKGQSLATLDDRDVKFQLASALSNYQAAVKKKDTALAARASGDLRLAQLELQQASLEIESLTEQLKHLKLESPMDGIVVQGDWYQSEGAPVSRGDTLFEIAPLKTMKIETHLSTEDLANIRVGNTASVFVDAASGRQWDGEIERIDTRGQVVDDEVVFVADIEIENENRVLRPGMKGTVRIAAGKKSVGWLLFHRPYRWLMNSLAW